jgi:DNA invertase Pin-like site-specific DNA recombinase
MADEKFVSYLRVSTCRQGASGLGLDAQRAAVVDFLQGAAPLAEFVEVETGRGADALDRRPQLRAALAYTKKHKARLVIAKLDRLSRNLHFVSGLLESGVEFTAADMPFANRMTVQLMAVFAEHEREQISARTKAALAAAKARGVILGANGANLARAQKAAAAERTAQVADELRELRGQGLSIRGIVAALSERGVMNPAGGPWSKATVHRSLKRLTALELGSA